MSYETKAITAVIAAPWQQVYAFAHAPQNLPRWAAGLAGAITQEDGEWVADSPMGKVRVRMAARNPHGVLDHDVTLPDGRVFHNPLRVIANGSGSEITFTLFRTEGVDDAAFARDAAAVTADLQTLKTLLEAKQLQPLPAFNDRCIDYVELAVSSIAQSKAFYGRAFGWTFKDYGPAYCEFADGRLTGGFTTASAPQPGGPLVVLYASDLEQAEADVGAAGGRISVPIFDFPGGRRFQFLDPDGYEFAVWSAPR